MPSRVLGNLAHRTCYCTTASTLLGRGGYLGLAVARIAKLQHIGADNIDILGLYCENAGHAPVQDRRFTPGS